MFLVTVVSILSSLISHRRRLICCRLVRRLLMMILSRGMIGSAISNRSILMQL